MFSRLLDIHLRMTEHEVSIFSCAWFCVQTEFFAFASVDSGQTMSQKYKEDIKSKNYQEVQKVIKIRKFQARAFLSIKIEEKKKRKKLFLGKIYDKKSEFLVGFFEFDYIFFKEARFGSF